MKHTLYIIAALGVLSVAACRTIVDPPEPDNFVELNSKTYVTDKAYRDTINQVLGSLSLNNGVHIRCQFKAFPTKDGLYRLTGLKAALDSDEVWVSATIPAKLPITDTADVRNYSSNAIGNGKAIVHVLNGKISINVVSSNFLSFPYPTDTVVLSANLAE